MKASVNYLHHQGTDWQRELDFYKQELGILTKRLEEVASRNTGKDIEANIEHYQNKFIVIREVIDTLHHDINKREERLDVEAKEHPQHINERQNEPADTLLGRMKDLTHSFADTRYEFNRFLLQVM